MAKNSNFSILADVELDLTSIQKQLKSNKIKFDVDDKSIQTAGQNLGEFGKQAKSAGEETEKLGKKSKDATSNIDDMALSVDAAGKMFRLAVETLTTFTNQIFELDKALTEFKKVSDLSGDSLDSYVTKLSNIGNSVGRTGKPNRSEPVCCDGKAA